MDAVNGGGGAFLATTSGATARMDMDGEHGGDSVGLTMGGGELANSDVRQIGARG